MADRQQIRRILVAIDHSPGSRAALEAAAELAEVFRAQLRGLFVAEPSLRALATHPVSSEVSLRTGLAREWGPDLLGLQLRARAEQARRRLHEVAERHHVEWSFSVVEEELGRAVLAASEEADLATVGRERWTAETRSQRRATGELVRSTRHLTLIHREGRLSALPPVVIYDGSEAAWRALDFVAQLPRVRGRRLEILVAARGEGAVETARRELEEWGRRHGLSLALHVPASLRVPGVLRMISLFRRHLVVLPQGSPLLRGHALGELLRLACSVLVVA